MKNRKKKNTIMFLLLLVLGITVGYAALATTLKINGTTKVNKNTWSVYWNSVSVTQGSKGDTIPSIGNDATNGVNTKVTWTVDFDTPGDFYEFTVNAVNAGSLDAMVTNQVTTISDGAGGTTLPPYVIYSVTYADGKSIENNHLLKKAVDSTHPTTETYKVRVEFSRSITTEQLEAIPEDGLSYTIDYAVTYSQATDDAVNRLGLIDTCVGCKFVHLEFSKSFIEPASILNGTERDFTKDFTTIKTEYNEQSRSFNGVLLDSNNKIIKGYVCGVVGTTPYCMEAATDGSLYTYNQNIIKAAFGEENCYFNETETALFCDDNNVPLDGGQDVGFAHAEVWDDGDIEVDDDFDSCKARTDGKIYCD